VDLRREFFFLAITALILIASKTSNKLVYNEQYFSTISTREIRSKANSNNGIDLPLNAAERELLNSEDLRALHFIYIKELYKDRKAPIKAFDDLVLDTCYDLDKEKLFEFLKKWRSKSCIYLIQYKHDPLIYYIGITTLFKRRLYNHLKADTQSKFHVFLNLVGREHFNVSIIEECSQ
jgi:hypothetical protein